MRHFAPWFVHCIGPPIALILTASVAMGQPAPEGTYRVFPLPIASPDHGSRILLDHPQDLIASPFGWHDTDGVGGAEFTILRGNNVWVYVDANADNSPDGLGPDGGPTLFFDYPADPNVDAPSAYAEALATNAFYLGNMFHDILWHHGFQEADGNFQENNYGNGGLGNDAVRIEILDGSGTNNADQTFTSEGSPPKIQFFVWTYSSPHREVSFDAGAAAFTYMHLVQGRLADPGCAGGSDRPTVGYSDFLGVLLTTDFDSTTPATSRGLATWLMNQPVTGNGLRDFPYSADMTVNPMTYADSATAGSIHDMGQIYASALWDLAWSLVQRDGASGNMVTGDGGENRVLRLVIEALKLQPCGPGLLDGRNAILQADGNLYQGRYVCDIWNAFGRRGMGVSASQGSTSSTADNIAAFDLPEICLGVIFVDGFDPEPVAPEFEQFCSVPGVIQLPAGQPSATSGSASVYPIPISVGGLVGGLDALRMQLFDLSHTFPSDLDLLLVAPGGQTLVLQSDAGGSVDASNVDYVIDDAAPSFLGGALTPGSYRPTDYNVGSSDAFVAPAPAGPYNNAVPTGTATLGNVFGDIDPNGTWNLYIVDAIDGDYGALNGVCLEVAATP